MYISGDTSTPSIPVKTEPVCVFLNQNYDSSDSEQHPSPVEDQPTKM